MLVGGVVVVLGVLLQSFTIAAYVRALQWSRHAPVAALPPEARGKLPGGTP